MIPIDFKDTCTLLDPSNQDEWNRPSPGSSHEIRCVLEQGKSETHASHADTISGLSRLILDPNDDYLASIAYEVEGMEVQVNLFGNADERQYFRIVQAKILKDHLLDNTPRHIACDIEAIRKNETVAS